MQLSREIYGVLSRLQAILIAEAHSLVAHGIISPEGLHDTACYRLGRRRTLLEPLAI